MVMTLAACDGANTTTRDTAEPVDGSSSGHSLAHDGGRGQDGSSTRDAGVSDALSSRHATSAGGDAEAGPRSDASSRTSSDSGTSGKGLGDSGTHGDAGEADAQRHGLPYVFHGTGVDCDPASNIPYGHCPFVSEIASLESAGKASVAIASSDIGNWWSQQCTTCGGGGNAFGDGPIYVYSAASGNASGIDAGPINTDATPVEVVLSTLYNTPPFNDLPTFLPSWATNQANCKSNTTGTDCDGVWDQHLSVIDLKNGYEIDGWECANVAGGGAANLDNLVYSGGQPYLACLYGARYPLGGPGTWATSVNGGSGMAGGAQLAAYITTPQEIIDAENGTPIGHALSFGVSCLGYDKQLGQWPARTGSMTDGACSGAGPLANYGQFLHLVSSYNVDQSSYSAPCKAVLHAMQTYGAMLSDTGEGGWYLNTLPSFVYKNDPTSPADPWNTIASQLAEGEDGSGTTADTMRWSYCLNRLTPNDVEIVTKDEQ